jgi:hypothetical protein
MAYDYSKKYPYPIGTKVSSRGVTGVVTATPGPYSVVVDDKITIPVSLITPTPEGK